jgi:hypothetical protein
MVNYQIISPPTGYGWSTPTAVNSHAIVVGRLNAIPNHLTRPVGFIFSQGELTVVEDAAFMAINDNNVIVGYIAQYRNWHRGLPNWTAATCGCRDSPDAPAYPAPILSSGRPQ